MTKPPFPRGVYGITPEWHDFARLRHAIVQSCEAGLTILQWRQKTQRFSIEQIREISKICRYNGTCFIVNDNWALALELEADGVHLGKDDAPLAKVQQASAGKAFYIGLSCYNDIQRAQAGSQADYLAFGAVFASRIKPEAPKAPLSLFTQARALLPDHCRLVAIGGITLDNAAQVYQAGADAVALISGLFDSDCIAQTTRELLTLVPHHD